MRKMMTATIAAGGLALVAATLPMSASAAPASGLSATPLPLAADAAPEVTLVSGGCGPFRHRGFYGFCRPNFYGGYGYGYGPRFYHPGFYRGYGWHRGWRHW